MRLTRYMPFFSLVVTVGVFGLLYSFIESQGHDAILPSSNEGGSWGSSSSEEREGNRAKAAMSETVFNPERPIYHGRAQRHRHSSKKTSESGAVALNNKRFKIRINDGWHGFFSQFLIVLNEIRYAEQEDLIPYVCITKETERNGPNRFFDVRHGSNVWEYYFLPISHVRPRNGSSKANNDATFTWAQERRLHMSNDAVKAYYYGKAHDSISNKERLKRNRYDEQFYLRHRTLAHRMVSEYVRVRPELFREVERYVAENFNNKPVLGVHMRGTDKIASAGGGPIVPAQEYHEYINDFLMSEAEGVVFVATDSLSLLEELKILVSDVYLPRILSREVMRSSKKFKRKKERLEQNIFLDDTVKDNYQKGKDVVLDVLILSQATYFIHGASSVSEAVFWFNLGLHHRSVHVQYEPASRQRIPWRKNAALLV
mmetsp:Transcript_6294/g.15201  ORF Transcript_6294/g.15201 Transcript_6294/m.15201 type:complete len:428 (-) Transcript_6294:4-1287(-)